jgi:hypothetical protein
MRFGTRNLSSPYRYGSFTTVARELGWFKLGLVGVNEVRWAKGAREGQGIIFFLYKKEGKSSIGNTIFVHHRIISAVKGAEFF